MIARPKTSTVLMFMCLDGCNCSIGAYPQQRWEAEPDGNMIRLTYKSITAKISRADFEETFKAIGK